MNIKNIIEDILITCDKNNGLIFFVKTGDFISCTPQHAKKLRILTKKYKNAQLSTEEKIELENYYRSIVKKPLRKCVTPKDLKKRQDINRLEFMISTTCNLNCIYCYANSGTYDYKQLIMSPQNITSYLNSIVTAGYNSFKTIMFFGGEPCLGQQTIKQCCQDIYHLYDENKIKSVPRFTMVTNGTLLDESMIKIIKDYNIRTTISLDGPKDINDKLRIFKDGTGTYNRIISGIKRMRTIGCKPNAIEATYTKLHQDAGLTKEDLKKYLAKISGSEKIIIENCIGEKNSNILPDISNAKTRKSIIYDVNFIHGIGAKTFSSVACGAGLSSFAVLPDGTLYPCHLFVKNINYKLGSISNGKFDLSIYEPIKNELLSLSKIKNKDCKSCWRKSICIDCPAGRLLENKNKNTCFYKSVYIENDMLDFLKLKLDTKEWKKIEKKLKKLREG